MSIPLGRNESDADYQPAPPESLSEWREWVLDGILRVTFVLWAVALTAGVFSVMRAHTWQERPLTTLILVGSYVLTAVAMGIVTFRRAYSFKLRSSVILATVYALGAVGIVRAGYAGDGRLFLFAFIAMTAIFYDLQRSLFALFLSIATIVTAAWLWTAGIIVPAAIVPTQWTEPRTWVTGGVVFLLLSVAMLLTVTFLIRSLDRSISDSRQERNFISAILETSGAMVVLFGLDGRIVRFNRACEQVTGFTFEEVRDKFVWDLFLTPGGVELTKTVFQQVQKGAEPSTYESYWLTKSRERRLIAWSTTVLRGQTGEIEYIVSTGIDITVHQEAEAERERLLSAEHEQRLLAETLAEITLSLTSQTSPTAVLDEILQRARRVVPFKTANILLLDGDTLRSARWQGYGIFGGEEAIANFLQPLYALPLEERSVESRQPLVIHDTRQESQWLALEGMGWVRSQLIMPIVQQDRVLGLLRLDGNTPGEFSTESAERLKPLVNAASIALERARLLQETMRQAQRVQQILDSAQDGIVLLDGNYRVELANPAAQEYLAVLTEGLNGHPVTKLAGQPLAKLIEPPPEGMSGHELTVGKERRIFETAVHPLQTGKESGGWVLVLREITEARKQQQYVQAQERLAMVGQLAAGIAHDFNNIMTVIILYAQMLLKLPQFASGDDQRMATLFRQAKLAANLISQILDFSRQSVMERRPVNLVYFLKELLKMLKRTLPENIRLDLVFEGDEYGVLVDLTRLQQAVMNLAVNARDAMPDGGTLTMELSHMSLAEDDKLPLPDMVAGEWVMLAVSDTGTGIKAEDLNRVFEPFFTTKEPGKGTGLGLAQVFGIIKQHGGSIDLTSVEGEGTTFRIYLPYHKLEDTLEPALEHEVVTEGGGETILVVEDDENTLEAVCEILKTLNYHALPASNGAQALEIFEWRHDEIELVISDMVMPTMSGSKLYTKLRELKPDIKMVIITGYPFGEEDRELLSQGIVAWIQKPFVMEQIASAIRDALTPLN
ncbi:MAG: PAS domain S-box protein [Ardenticatenaceae bacterium]|nr:PAS domain S-box protein [Ardenticatenaceae bacterium]MCB9442991.1 PAS domain S-box protein [Ardenticatenaceae bacterium]